MRRLRRITEVAFSMYATEKRLVLEKNRPAADNLGMKASAAQEKSFVVGVRRKRQKL